MEKYELARTDYNQYQKWKKNKMNEKGKDKEKSISNKQSVDKAKSGGRASIILSKKSASDKSTSQVGTSIVINRDSQPTDGLTPEWTDHLDEQPMLISDFPKSQSFLDYYFNLESNQWSKFSLDMEMNDA
mmetsp:Transcript_42572/g.65300  ORF Transcript_42572/g.65300 Transcript_42572/m.65300 type:complete len:130 (+) Transcript_42572:4227-4616(+)